MVMGTTFKWGIIGPGFIAHQFTKGISVLEDVEISAVASRSLKRANAFADEYEIAARYGNYAELAEDPTIDAVYVATPHPFHRDHSILCLKAGKAVLCEKPLTVNAHQAAELIKTARSSSVFLMEGMWTRFLPIYTPVREWLSQGVIGDVRMLQADFGFRVRWGPEDRHINLQLAGGALLDVGVYELALASMVFQRPPKKIQGISYIGSSGVDEQSAMLLGYDLGQLAVFSVAVTTPTPHEAWICGTEGRIHIPDFWHATRATLSLADGKQIAVERPFDSTGFQFEAAEVVRCVREGKRESEVMPLDESLEILATLDRVRAQCGVEYPIEGEVFA